MRNAAAMQQPQYIILSQPAAVISYDSIIPSYVWSDRGFTPSESRNGAVMQQQQLLDSFIHSRATGANRPGQNRNA